MDTTVKNLKSSPYSSRSLFSKKFLLVWGFLMIAVLAFPRGVALADGDMSDGGSSGDLMDMPSSGDFYDSPSSGNLYDNASSGSLNDKASSGDYYDYTPVSSYSSGSGSGDYYDYTPVSSYSSSAGSYVPYSSGCSSGCGGGSYIAAAPSVGYTYVPTASAGSASQMQYVSSSNSNASQNKNAAAASNTNTITNNPVNVFNPTNNNNPKINLVILGGGSSAPAAQPLQASCMISPSTSYVGQNISFAASATGGSGSYAYYWTGDNGLSASSQSFTGQFSYAGYKTATVTVTSGGQSVSASCSTNVVAYAPTVLSQSTTATPVATGNPVSGIFLSQVPATGISMSLKMILFSSGLLTWSAFAAFILNEKRKKHLSSSVTGTAARFIGGNSDMKSRIEAFKLKNMTMRMRA